MGAFDDILISKKLMAVSEQVIDVSSSSSTSGLIPSGAVLVGLYTKNDTAVVGPTDFDVGDGTDVDRFAAGASIALDSTTDNTDWTDSTVENFPTGGDVTLTPNGGAFTSGSVRVRAVYLDPPGL